MVAVLELPDNSISSISSINDRPRRKRRRVSSMSKRGRQKQRECQHSEQRSATLNDGQPAKPKRKGHPPKPLYLPSPAEIEAQCRAIREGTTGNPGLVAWDEQTYRIRAGIGRQPDPVDVVSANVLFGGQAEVGDD